MSLRISTTRRALLFGAGLTAVGVLAKAASWPRRRATLRIGFNTWPGYELLYLAREQGFFEEQGLDVRLVELGSLGDARRAYEVGQVDAIATTIVEVLVARDVSRRDLRVVEVIDVSKGADMIVARADVTTPVQLRGKRVGVEVASLGLYLLARALERAGVALDDVTIVSKDQRTMRRDLLTGHLDAVVTYPPESVAMLADARFKVLFSSAEVPNEVVDVLAVDGGWARSNRGGLEALIAGYRKALAFARAQPATAHALMAAREGITPAEFAALLDDGMALVGPEQQAAFVGPEGSLGPVIALTASSLRRVGALSPRRDVTDCLWSP